MSSQKTAYYIHIVIVFFFMFGFGHLPAIDPLTPIGMKILGIFLGAVYGWTTSNIIWTSLLAMVAVVANGVCTMAEWLPISFANEIVVFVFFTFLFAGAITDTGITDYLTAKILSFKFINGRPWIFTLTLFVIAYICSLINPFAAIIFIRQILYKVFEAFGFQPGERYPNLMLLGIIFCALTVFTNVLPFDVTALTCRSALMAISGIDITFAQWYSFSIPMSIVLILTYVFMMRFVFRIDLSRMKQINNESVGNEAMPDLNKMQKLALSYILMFVILCTSTGILPIIFPDLAISQFLANVGLNGVTIFLLMIMMITHVNGEPLIDLKQALQGVDWSTVCLFAFIFPFSGYITADNAGITTLITQTLYPVVEGRSFIILFFVVLLLATIVSNFFNDSITMIIWITVCTPFCMKLNINPIILTMLIGYCTTYSYLTPAASAAAAFYYSDTGWIKISRKLMIDIIIMMLGIFIVTFGFGVPYLTLLY